MRTTVTVVLTLALLAGCALLPARAADIRYAPPKVELTLDSTSYEPGASLAWRYTLYNGNDHPLDLVFPTTQVYDLAIWKGDAMLARWSTGKEFAAVTSTTTVGMGETIELTGSWTLPADLEPGTYRLEFILTSTTPEPTGTSAEFAVQPAVADSLQVRFTSDHLIYRVGTALRVQCVITNTSDRDVTLSFPTEQQYTWSVVECHGTTVFDWAEGQTFAAQLTTRTIPAGGSITFESSWSIPRDLAASGFYLHFTILSDQLGSLTTHRAAVLIGGTPPPE